jgi:hypothetical protein
MEAHQEHIFDLLDALWFKCLNHGLYLGRGVAHEEEARIGLQFFNLAVVLALARQIKD